jgi:hypothetical protein
LFAVSWYRSKQAAPDLCGESEKPPRQGFLADLADPRYHRSLPSRPAPGAVADRPSQLHYRPLAPLRSRSEGFAQLAIICFPSAANLKFLSHRRKRVQELQIQKPH